MTLYRIREFASLIINKVNILDKSEEIIRKETTTTAVSRLLFSTYAYFRLFKLENAPEAM